MRPNGVPAEEYVALTQLKHEYCHRIDHGDYDGWVDLFTDDGEFVRAGEDRFEGATELRRFATDVFDERFEFTAHLVSNPVLSVDGDEATGRWYLYLLYTTRDGDTGWTQARYEDEYRRVDGAWRVRSSTVHYRASGGDSA